MFVLIGDWFAAIGWRSVRFEFGWFDGVTPALLHIALCEWQHVKHVRGLDYYCLFEMQVVKFCILLTIYPDRICDEDLIA